LNQSGAPGLCFVAFPNRKAVAIFAGNGLASWVAYPGGLSCPWLEAAPAIDKPFGAKTCFAEAAALGIEGEGR
jgi:hypothetical protein